MDINYVDLFRNMRQETLAFFHLYLSITLKSSNKFRKNKNNNKFNLNRGCQFGEYNFPQCEGKNPNCFQILYLTNNKNINKFNHDFEGPFSFRVMPFEKLGAGMFASLKKFRRG